MYGTEKCLKVPQLEPVVADLQEFEAACSMQGVPSKPRLYSETLSSKNGEKKFFSAGFLHSRGASGKWDISGFQVEMGEMLSKLVPEGADDRIEGRAGENIT